MKKVDGARAASKAARNSLVPHRSHRAAATEQALDESPGNDLGTAAAHALGPLVDRGIGEFRDAIRTGQVRLLAVETTDGRPLPSGWAVPLEEDEVVVALARLPQETREGVAALVVARAALPQFQLDDAIRDRIASSVADALLAEVES